MDNDKNNGPRQDMTLQNKYGCDDGPVHLHRSNHSRRRTGTEYTRETTADDRLYNLLDNDTGKAKYTCISPLIYCFTLTPPPPIHINNCSTPIKTYFPPFNSFFTHTMPHITGTNYDTVLFFLTSIHYSCTNKIWFSFIFDDLHKVLIHT